MKQLNNYITILKYTFIEQIRNRFFYSVLLVSLPITLSVSVISFFALHLSLDNFYGVIFSVLEFIFLLSSAYLLATIFLSDIKSKHLYLIVSRKVSLLSYVFAKNNGAVLTLLLAALINIFLFLTISLLFYKDISIQLCVMFIMMILKVAAVGGYAMFFALLYKSDILGVLFSIVLLIAGYNITTLQTIVANKSIILSKIIKLLPVIIADMNVFNVKQYYNYYIQTAYLLNALLYGAFICLIYILLTYLILKNKDL